MHDKSREQLRAVHDAVGIAWQQFAVQLESNGMRRRHHQQCQQEQASLPLTDSPRTLPLPVSLPQQNLSFRDQSHHQLHPDGLTRPHPIAIQQRFQPLSRQYNSTITTDETNPIDNLVNIDPDLIMEILQDYQSKQGSRSFSDVPNFNAYK